ALALTAAGCQPALRGPSPPGTSTADFLGPDDFVGDYRPRGCNAAFGAEAIYHGRVIAINIPDNVASKVLPSGFHLAANPVSSPDQHPILLFLGHQTHTKYVFPGWSPPVGNDYTEVIVVVPFVQKDGSSHWHNYVARIYLDDLPALYVGNLYYGMMKEEANFTETTTTLDVYRNGVHWFQASFSSTATWTPSAVATTSLPNYRALLTMLEMPVQGTLTYLGGQPVCSYFEWNCDDVQVRPISSQVRFLEPLQTGVTSWPALGTVSGVSDGAWELQGLRWRMAFPPLDCEF